MPIYVYELTDDDSGEQFELFQKMSDSPLTKHPETGEAIRRVVTAPHISTKYSAGSTKKMLSDKNLDRLGFTKYVKKDGGGYERAVGQGPEHLSPPD